MNLIKPKCDAVLQELHDAQGTEALKLVGASPVRSIREVKEDGTDIFIGDVDIGRCGYGEFFGTDGVDWAHRDLKVKENEDRKLGDQDIIWDFGGILTSAFSSLNS